MRLADNPFVRITVEHDPFVRGLIVRWSDFAMLVDPTGAWLVWRGRVVMRAVVGQA